MGERLFPIFCLGCGSEGNWLCSACLLKPETLERPLDTKKTNLDGVFSLFAYSEPLVAKLIKKLKYHGAVDVLEIFDFYLERFLARHTLPVAVLVPIPLHRRRYLQRGFNQSELIANSWSRLAERPLAIRSLRRVRATQPQAGLGGVEREDNVAGAFAVRGRLDGEAIILVDDVFTTGSTLQEAARVCRAAGAAQVWGLTIAREF